MVERTEKVSCCASHPYADTEFILTPELQAYGKLICTACGKFIKWVPKPENEKRPKRESAKLKKVFEAVGVDYCQVCLRTQSDLPDGVVFHAHHVVEVRDGGTDDPANIWHLCTICHEMVHLLRRNRNDKDRRPSMHRDSEHKRVKWDIQEVANG